MSTTCFLGHDYGNFLVLKKENYPPIVFFLPLLRTYRCGGDVNEQGEGFKCDRCGRSCALFENPDVRNEQIRQRILEQAEKQKSKK